MLKISIFRKGLINQTDKANILERRSDLNKIFSEIVSVFSPNSIYHKNFKIVLDHNADYNKFINCGGFTKRVQDNFILTNTNEKEVDNFLNKTNTGLITNRLNRDVILIDIEPENNLDNEEAYILATTMFCILTHSYNQIFIYSDLLNSISNTCGLMLTNTLLQSCIDDYAFRKRNFLNPDETSAREAQEQIREISKLPVIIFNTTYLNQINLNTLFNQVEQCIIDYNYGNKVIDLDEFNKAVGLTKLFNVKFSKKPVDFKKYKFFSIGELINSLS